MGRTARRFSPAFVGPSHRRQGNLPHTCPSVPGAGHMSPPEADASLKLRPPSLPPASFSSKSRELGAPWSLHSELPLPAGYLPLQLFVFARPAPIVMSKLVPNHRCRLSSTTCLCSESFSAQMGPLYEKLRDVGPGCPPLLRTPGSLLVALLLTLVSDSIPTTLLS